MVVAAKRKTVKANFRTEQRPSHLDSYTRQHRRSQKPNQSIRRLPTHRYGYRKKSKTTRSYFRLVLSAQINNDGLCTLSTQVELDEVNEAFEKQMITFFRGSA